MKMKKKKPFLVQMKKFYQFWTRDMVDSGIASGGNIIIFCIRHLKNDISKFINITIIINGNF